MVLDHDHIDQLRELLGDDDEGIGDLIDTYLEDCPSTLTALHEAAKADDAKALASAAHKLKGASGSMGAQALYEASRDLEDDARDGLPDDVDARLDEIDALWEKTEAELTQARP